MKTFGKRNDDLNYCKRTGAYAVIQNEKGQFLCVEEVNGYLFLAGEVLRRVKLQSRHC